MSCNDETVCLADDEVTQILQWLAPEVLMRFRTACKSWFSMITATEFIAQYQRHNAGNGRIIILKDPTFPDPPFQATFQFHIFSDNINPGPHSAGKNVGTIQNLPIWGRRNMLWHVQGTCNGFFCSTARTIMHLINLSTVYVCNPSMRWATLIPDYPFEFLPRTNGRVADDTYGIGFDSTERDYKILKMRIGHSCYAEAAIFSLKSRTWKQLECPVRHRDIDGRSVFSHGSIHWVSYSQLTENKDTTSIISFNIHDQVFREIQVPNSDRDSRHITASVHVVRGSLCAMILEMRETLSCEVWTMKEYGVVESWEEEFRVEFQAEIQCLEVTAGGKLLCQGFDMMARGGNLVPASDNEGSSVCCPPTFYQQLILYDPKTHQYANISRTSSDSSFFSIVCSFDFPDSH